MKVLHLLPYSPAPAIFGRPLREYDMLKILAKYHSVAVLTCGDASVERTLREYSGSRLDLIHTVRFFPIKKKSLRHLLQFYLYWTGSSFAIWMNYNERMQGKIDQILAENGFDVIQIEFSYMGRFRLATDAIKMLDCHNIEYDCFRQIRLNTQSLFRRYHYYREHRKSYHEEIEAWRNQDVILGTSEPDRALLNRGVLNIPKLVVPNGVDASYFEPAPDS
jgi:glycosyltransferase involved in cell wall biosynthesis